MKLQKGFTLVELMVAVAIVAILTAIAVPSYRQHVVKSNRSAAEGFMLTVSNKQEQYMLDARLYANDPGALTTLGLTTPAEVSRNYNITVAANNAATPPSYTITAAPTGTQQTSDATCGNLTLDQTGSKGVSGTGPAAACW